MLNKKIPLKRRLLNILALLFATALLMSMAACAGQASAQQPASTAAGTAGAAQTDVKPPVELIFWYCFTDKIQENNVNLAEKFNETRGKEMNIHVTAEYQGSYDELHQKLQAAHVAKDVPSVTVMEIASIKTFAENNVILPLTSYINRDAVDVGDFFPGLMINCRVGDDLYGLPYLRSTPIMYLNATLLKAAGLDPKGPQTWDEFAHYCRTVKEKTGAYGMSMYSYIWTFEAFMLASGSHTVTADETKSNINTPEAKEALSFYQGLIDEGVIRCVAGADSAKVTADQMNQNCAMWYWSTANLTQNLAIAEENGFELNVCFFPENKSRGVPTGGCNLIMTALQSDDEKEASWQFIKWMTEPEQAAYAHLYTGYVPSRKAAAESPEVQEKYKEFPQFGVALEQLGLYGHGRPMNPGYAQASVEMVGIMDAIWVNDADIDSTVTAAEPIINQMLAR